MLSLFDIVSGITDNWIWLRRVGLTDFYKPWQKRWIEWTASFSTLMVILLTIVDKVLDAYIKARIQLREDLAQAKMVGDSRGGTGSPEIFIELDDKEKRSKVFLQIFMRNIYNRRLYLGQKLFDIPVLLYYLNLWLSRGQGHLLSLPSPVLFLVRHFTQ